MKKELSIFLLLLVGCAAPLAEETADCGVLKTMHEGACCNDFNENGLCDRLEPDVQQQIKELEQQEYEEAAAKAQEQAGKTPQFVKTPVDAFLEQARTVARYAYQYAGDAYLVEPGKITISLVTEKDIGKRDVEGRQEAVKINTVILEHGTATGYCIPDPDFSARGIPGPCQHYPNQPFEVAYFDFKTMTPLNWLEQFEHRTPAVVLERQNVGKRGATLLKMKDAGQTTLIYVDPALGLPIRVELVEQGKIYEYVDLFGAP